MLYPCDAKFKILRISYVNTMVAGALASCVNTSAGMVRTIQVCRSSGRKYLTQYRNVIESASLF